MGYFPGMSLRWGPPDGRFWNPPVQTLSHDELRRLQLERLGHALERIWTRPIPFFRRKLEAAHLAPADIRSLADLAAIPVTVKEELRASERDVPPFGDYRGPRLEDCVRVGASTGTSGRPTYILWTRRDLEVDDEAACRGRYRWGLRPGMSCAHAHPFGLYGGGWHFSHGLEALGVLNVPLGPPATAAQVDDAVEVWRRVRPAEVRLFGNAAAKFSEGARRRGLDPARDLGLTVAGEDPRAQYRTVSAGLEALGMLGTACAEADGAHVCEDLAIVEILDRRTRRPVGDGARGVLIVTTLEKDNLMLRYDLEDVVRTNYRPCPCGETHVRLFWEGRAKDIVPVAGRELLPIDVALALAAVPDLTRSSPEYQIVRRRSDDGRLHLRLELPSEMPEPDFPAAVERALAERLGVATKLRVVPHGTLPRFDFKAARVVDAEP